MSSSDKHRSSKLILILPDQLNADSHALKNADPETDRILLLEAALLHQQLPWHKHRLIFYLSAMRHFAEELEESGFQVDCPSLFDDHNGSDWQKTLRAAIKQHQPGGLHVVQPGDYSLQQALKTIADKNKVPLEIITDRHFFMEPAEFCAYADERSSLLMEHFYHKMRRQTGLLMEGDKPVGGQWNYDADNRKNFGSDGPPKIKAPRSFRPDAITRKVMEQVDEAFKDSPGESNTFDLPVTHKQALEALRDFIQHRLEVFGDYQDAMVDSEPYLYHSRLSAVLNAHLLDPRHLLDRVVKAFEDGDAPLNSVEGFVRQILGWREYIRGIYWWTMPDMIERNALEADLPLPAFYRTGDTSMHCVHCCISQLIDHSYTHHIQRLMVLGLLPLLMGVRPLEVHGWHLAMHVDALEWVSLPNVVGMSQYADGGIVGTKPYIASGRYIDRMSNYCQDCRYDPASFSGDDACPFTVLYWDFLLRHQKRFADHPRMKLQVANLKRKTDDECRSIRKCAKALKDEMTKERFF